MNDEKEKVSDLGLASLLLTLHFDLVGMERVNEKRVNFLFTNSKEVKKAVSDYWANIPVSIPVQSLFNSQKLLKNRLYSFK